MFRLKTSDDWNNWGITAASLGGLFVILNSSIPDSWQLPTSILAATLALGGLYMILRGNKMKKAAENDANSKD